MIKYILFGGLYGGLYFVIGIIVVALCICADGFDYKGWCEEDPIMGVVFLWPIFLLALICLALEKFSKLITITIDPFIQGIEKFSKIIAVTIAAFIQGIVELKKSGRRDG